MYASSCTITRIRINITKCSDPYIWFNSLIANVCFYTLYHCNVWLEQLWVINVTRLWLQTQTSSWVCCRVATWRCSFSKTNHFWFYECKLDDGPFYSPDGVSLERTPATLNKAGPPAGGARDEFADALEELIFTWHFFLHVILCYVNPVTLVCVYTCAFVWGFFFFPEANKIFDHAQKYGLWSRADLIMPCCAGKGQNGSTTEVTGTLNDLR